MTLVKKYLLSIIIVLVLAGAVVARFMTSDKFSGNPGENIMPSITGEAILTSEMAQAIKGKLLIVDLDSSGFSLEGKDASLLNISQTTLVKKENISKITEHGCPVLLYSDQPAKSAESWMVLRQMGIKLLFILADSGNNEILKYKFRPDTIARPESE